ncbi:MAG: hypothetical protein LBS04_04130 [Tannerellaceae bacterium]|jgi:hypothetical protein|nr:hypothetical protein [Tannerellaceae bacterium]
MKKFKCTVTRTDEYIIEIDENIINDEWMRHFRSYMYSFYTLEEHAKHLAQFQARIGDYDFIEGYGHVKRNGKLLFSGEDYDSQGRLLPEDQRREPGKGINIVKVNEDNDCEVEVEEIKD